MRIKKIYKVFIAILFVNFVENIILLLFFGIQPTKQTLIGAGVFTLVLTLILNQMHLLQKE